MGNRTYGEIDGYPVGSTFVDRQAAVKARVHRNGQMGVVGGQDGAESVVLSGGYRDEDYGDVIIYTGHGGRDHGTKRRNGHQELVKGNLGLTINVDTKLPVRVLRGETARTQFSPKKGLRYNGLYRVAESWCEMEEGWRTWRFRLEAVGELVLDYPSELEAAAVAASSPTRRTERNVSALIRQVGLARRIKEMYDYRCQICNAQLTTPTGMYAEAAHVRGLGKPHDGLDVLENLLCLCPNDHVLFDRGAIIIRNDWAILDTRTGEVVGELTVDPGHKLNVEYVTYHAKHFSASYKAWSHGTDDKELR